MTQLVFDIEADGLLKKITKVHCIGILDVETGELTAYGPDALKEALDRLYNADVLIGHNIIGYDLPALKKVLNWDWRAGTRRIDTLITARLVHSGISKEDAKRVGFPGKLVGSHSLRAWGERLGESKGDYDGPWDAWSQEMQDYMLQDVNVTYRLFKYLKPWEVPQAPLDLEHRVGEICHEIEVNGWPFDIKGAQELYTKLATRRDELEQSLKTRFGTWKEFDRVLVPKRDNRTRGYLKGVPVTIYKDVVFNPGSRVHIEKKLREAGWEPEEFTPSGRAKLDEPILLKINIPEAKEIIEYLLVEKRLGQLADGDNGWLRVVEEDGRIHGSITSIGTVHHRASHSSPNLGQVPNAYSPYGPECRKLFTVPTGWKLVGGDMSGAQLRCLAHWLHHFDNGKYADIVTTGDIHTYHQSVCEGLIPSRDQAKTTIYAKLFGAQSNKIGNVNGGDRNLGQRILDALSDKIPGLGALEKAVKLGCVKGWLKGLDGRRIPVDSDRLGLNYLVTNTEAILCKQWMVDFYDTMCLRYECGWDKDFVIVGWIHDELQVACRECLSVYVAETLKRCAANAGLPFGFKVKLKGDAKIGDNWSETH